MLVSWLNYENQNTWEPVKNLPPEMVAAFGNRRKKRKASATEEADDSQPEMVASATEDATSLQDNLVEEISKRAVRIRNNSPRKYKIYRQPLR